MGKSHTQVARVISRLSDKLDAGRRFLKNEILFATATTLVDSQSSFVSADPTTHIIIICLSYHGMFWNFGTRTSMTLNGPKRDLFLLLDHFKYDESDNSTRFNLLHDFDILRPNSAGQPIHIRKTDTSKAAIKKAIKKTMESVAPGDKVLFYFGGHATEGLKDQAIVTGNGEPLSGSELRSWLSNTPHESVSVAAVFDACHSGGSMGLPYNYEVDSDKIQVDKVSRKKVKTPMIQISAARPDQLAYSNRFKDGYYGQLTWCLLQYLKNTTVCTIEGLTSYLYTNCDPSGAQLPQVSASHLFQGPVSFF